MVVYLLIAVLLLVLELAYFKVADKCNIIDKPNLRSSHSSCTFRRYDAHVLSVGHFTA